MVSMIHWPPFMADLGSEDPLQRVKKILRELGNPQDKLKNVFHLTGTNGKGSTAAFIFAILQRAGYKVNLYTSPHIYRYNERIVVNGREISDSKLAYFLEQVREICERLDIMPSIFEATTIAAFCAFAESNCDANVIEVGMGGRIDATNVFEECDSLTAIFTPIHVDHVAFLGDTPAQNALEKSFIIKTGARVISSFQLPEVRTLLAAIANDRGCDFYNYGQDYEVELIDEVPDKILFTLRGNQMICEKPKLLGKHQLLNVSTAITALLLADELNIILKNIDEGIQSANWPVRLEKVKALQLLELLPLESELYLDGAHNISGAKVVADFLAEQNDRKDNYIIIGRSKDTDSVNFLAQFKDIIRLAVAVTVKLEALPEPAETIVAAGQQAGVNIVKANNIEDAIRQIVIYDERLNSFGASENVLFHADKLDKVGNIMPIRDDIVINSEKHSLGSRQGIRIVICGSLYLARDVQIYN